MKSHYLSLLRSSSTPTEEFRRAAIELSRILAIESVNLLPLKKVPIQTPLSPIDGSLFDLKAIFIVILRSGLAMLPSFLELFPSAPMGFIGIKRDEKTALPHLYYINFPEISSSDWVFLLDPMLATGQSALLALKKIFEKGGHPKKTIFTSIVASKEGNELIKKTHPELRMVTAAIDPELNPQKFIIPGLGDFGDRFFATP